MSVVVVGGGVVTNVLLQLMYASLQVIFILAGCVEFLLQSALGFGPHDVDEFELVDAGLEPVVGLDELFVGLGKLEMTVGEGGGGAWRRMT